MYKAGIFICRLLSMMTCSLWLFSCAPELELKMIPHFDSVASYVMMNECGLSAVVSDKLTAEYEIGFYYGQTQSNMVKIPARWVSSNTMGAHLTSLDYGSEYVYKAFISNGYNEICSDVERFRTDKEQYLYLIEKEVVLPYEQTEYLVELLTNVDYEVIIPSDVHWISHHMDKYKSYLTVQENEGLDERSCPVVFRSKYHDAQQTLTVVQEGYSEDEGSAMILPFNTLEVGCNDDEFIVQIGGRADFIVQIDSGAEWLKYSREGRTCCFSVNKNVTFNVRSAHVTFWNLSTDKSESLFVTQAAFSAPVYHLPFSEVELPSGKQSFQFSVLGGGWTVVFPGKIPDWITNEGIYNDDDFMCLFLSFDKNITYEERTYEIRFSRYGTEETLTITQKPWNGIIGFDDSEIKKACVDAYDFNMDGELSYSEVSEYGITDLNALDFSGKNVKSFDEFRWFSEVEVIDNALFEGSTLESIRFPGNFSVIGEKVFSNCTCLTDIDLSFITVCNSAFKGCSALKDITACVIGESAFEDCTGLKTVVQQSEGVNSYAFRNCSSLRSFEFHTCSGHIDYIGKEAFKGCVSLPEIIIPDYISSIKAGAFQGCSSLSSVYVEAAVPPRLGADVFAGTSQSLKIYVNPAYVDVYKKSWSSLADRIIGLKF